MGMSSSQLTFIFFRGIETTNQIPYTLWLFNIAMEHEHDPFIDDIPIKSDDFPWHTIK